MILQPTDDGELLALRQGSRVMPLIYTHLIPATLDGRARMNVANALAAAAAAWAHGAHLHDIRQGLRTFTTSFFQAPGRLNEVEVRGTKVIIDYCHNVDGMRRLAEFVTLTLSDAPRGRRTAAAAAGTGRRTGRAIGIIGIPGDRRDQDMREFGAIAATAFDELIVREDANRRGREPGETAAIVVAGIERARAEGARCAAVEVVLPELDAARAGISRSAVGDLVVVCADDAAGVHQEAMALDRGPRMAIADPGESFVPRG
jgi:cyanophycin synthetase